MTRCALIGREPCWYRSDSVGCSMRRAVWLAEGHDRDKYVPGRMWISRLPAFGRDPSKTSKKDPEYGAAAAGICR